MLDITKLVRLLDEMNHQAFVANQTANIAEGSPDHPDLVEATAVCVTLLSMNADAIRDVVDNIVSDFQRAFKNPANE